MFLQIMSLAWRNLWRKKRRTALTLSAIALGLGAMILTVNITAGTERRLINSSTQSLTGHAQIQHKDYRETGEPEFRLHNVDALLAKLDADPGIAAASPRIITTVLAAMGDRSSSLTLYGVDPQREGQITNWQKRLKAGSYLSETNDVMIGAKLAEKLEVEEGGKLVLTSADLITGDLNSQLVRVSGIVVSESGLLNSYAVITTLELARKLSGLEEDVHQIALTSSAVLEDVESLQQTLSAYEDPAREVAHWRILLEPLIGMMEMQDFFEWIMFGVIFLLAAFGIANTMGMSILERVREFGVLQAIGTTPGGLGMMVFTEYVTLGITGAALGFGVGVGVSQLLAVTGIPLNNVEMMGMVMNEPLYPVMDYGRSLLMAVVFLLLVPLFAIVPIRKVMKYEPAQSLRFEG